MEPGAPTPVHKKRLLCPISPILVTEYLFLKLKKFFKLELIYTWKPSQAATHGNSQFSKKQHSSFFHSSSFLGRQTDLSYSLVTIALVTVEKICQAVGAATPKRSPTVLNEIPCAILYNVNANWHSGLVGFLNRVVSFVIKSSISPRMKWNMITNTHKHKHSRTEMKGFWKMVRNPSFIFRTCGQRIQIALSKSSKNNQHQTSHPSNHRTIEPWIHRTNYPSNQRSIEPANHRSIEPKIHRTKDPSNQRSIEPKIHQTKDPSNQRSIKPKIHRTSEPAIHWTTEPLNQRVMLPVRDLNPWPLRYWCRPAYLHRYRRGHRFKSLTGLNFFRSYLQLLISVLFSVARIS